MKLLERFQGYLVTDASRPILDAFWSWVEETSALHTTNVLLQHYENLKLELTVTNDVLSDMQSAIRFVEEYLYNVDPATAGAIINYKLKEKFVSFKTPDLKALVSKQKQPYVQNREMDDGGTLLNESNVPQCLVMYFAMLKAYSMYLF